MCPRFMPPTLRVILHTQILWEVTRRGLVSGMLDKGATLCFTLSPYGSHLLCAGLGGTRGLQNDGQAVLITAHGLAPLGTIGHSKVRLFLAPG